MPLANSNQKKGACRPCPYKQDTCCRELHRRPSLQRTRHARRNMCYRPNFMSPSQPCRTLAWQSLLKYCPTPKVSQEWLRLRPCLIPWRWLFLFVFFILIN
ncbi:hypothetical protein NC653_011907 [Populus alba x Populus x berolinensis]|uniref:Uncharacterized protein n=1 Tax=Populus alba x Populus x berolinensis TaxID=444605 RepID=A0AAD6R3E8_9ROSI|nr:hypothetical protein NC653_011898 [Populus alba x Populus x berolinensis]KAJ7001635.1 hypothetical protein NC653_011905 [Populus alba x Populus x berolinensis]KAJ7001637.1 hypothetical protein NC653_011907 [Populus alba x Populus x berolinensis]